ncbi:MAG: hypothetical protein RIC29_07270 [Rhodospirillaceae bacterium]
MASITRQQLKQRLPRFARISFVDVFSIVGTLASVSALTLVFLNVDEWSNSTKDIIFISYLFSIIVFLIAYILIKEHKKLHRYAQAAFHCHYINHVIRDYLSDLRLGRQCDLKVNLIEILDSVSTCFSILTGRRCRASIKEVKSDLTIVTVSRDQLSPNISNLSVVHELDENTDFHDIWYGVGGRIRYFLGNNLPTLWRDDQYKNTSFEIYGKPDKFNLLGFSFVRHWNLPYKSTLVWPIRYIPDYQHWPPPKPGLSHTNSTVPDDRDVPHILGFLCIDCVSASAFDDVYCPELGGSYADALYTLFSQSNELEKLRNTKINAGESSPGE